MSMISKCHAFFESKLTGQCDLYSRDLIAQAFQLKDPSRKPSLAGIWLAGSLARRGSNPQSDIDLIYLRSKNPGFLFHDEFVNWDRFTFRVREIESLETILEEQDIFGIINLLQAEPLDPAADEPLRDYQSSLCQMSEAQKKIWIKAIASDFNQRSLQFSGKKQALEPNLKFGPGSLRDLLQLQFLQVLTGKASDARESRKAIGLIDELRFFTSQFSKNQTLVAAAQLELAQIYKADQNQMMHVIQSLLEEVHFQLQEYFSLKSPQRSRVRKHSQSRSIFSQILQSPTDRELTGFFRSRQDEIWNDQKVNDERAFFFNFKRWNELHASHLESLWLSRYFDHIVPDFDRLRYYTQFDQYHRFTAGRHILEVLGAVIRFYQKPRDLFSLKSVMAGIKGEASDEWDILVMTALFHDIKKGTGGDHSDKGAFLAEMFLQDHWPVAKVQELKWLCKNHLAFTQLAFRKNIEDEQVVIEAVKDLQLNPDRIRRLLFFSACDIAGSDPDSWTEWKSQLLLRLHRKLTDHISKKQWIEKTRFPAWVATHEQLWFANFTEVWGLNTVEKELARVSAKLKRKELEVTPDFHVVSRKNMKTNKSLVWVRVMSPSDRYGFLDDVLKVFLLLGISVLESRVQTLQSGIVYDAFLLSIPREKKAKELVQKFQRFYLQAIEGKVSIDFSKVKIDSIELTSQSLNRWSLVFRAKDQRGLLQGIVANLTELGAMIVSARVSTWGELAEDYFEIEPLQEEPQFFLDRLKVRLLTQKPSL